MNDQIVPFGKKVTPHDNPFLTLFAMHAIQVLERTGRSSKVIWQGEPPQLPFVQNGWELKPVESEYTLPIEVQRRINILRNNRIPIKQVLIAHELPPPATVRQAEPKRLQRPRDASNVLSRIWRGLTYILACLAILLAASAIIPQVASIVSIVAGQAVPVLLTLAFFTVAATSMLVVDPVVVCILDDEDESWLEIGFWFE